MPEHTRACQALFLAGNGEHDALKISPLHSGQCRHWINDDHHFQLFLCAQDADTVEYNGAGLDQDKAWIEVSTAATTH